MLDIADIVEELLDGWHNVIANEVHTHSNIAAEHYYPKVYRIDPGNGEPVVEVHMGQYQHPHRRWRPDVSLIIYHAIDAIKQNAQKQEDLELALQLLEYDIATMTHHQLLPNVPANALEVAYTHGRMKLAKLAAVFGKKLAQRFIEFGLYKGGYFPYHFAGWQDTCALVELDDTHR